MSFRFSNLAVQQKQPFCIRKHALCFGKLKENLKDNCQMLKLEIHEMDIASIFKKTQCLAMPCDPIYRRKLTVLKRICVNTVMKSCLGVRDLKSLILAFIFFFLPQRILSGCVTSCPSPLSDSSKCYQSMILLLSLLSKESVLACCPSFHLFIRSFSGFSKSQKQCSFNQFKKAFKESLNLLLVISNQLILPKQIALNVFCVIALTVSQ